MKILVLCGGESPERIVSLASGDSVALWIKQAGHEVIKYDPENYGRYFSHDEKMAPDEIGAVAPEIRTRAACEPAALKHLIHVLDELKPDLVFPILHGGHGEDGTLQAILDWIGMPYTGSGALASAMVMNKETTRIMMSAVGVPVTKGFVVDTDEMDKVDRVAKRIESSFGYPVVVKPLNGGSTIGLNKVYSPEELPQALREVEESGDAALIEAHFRGKEIAATIIDGKAYPLIEIRPKAGFYDYTNKYTSGKTEYIVPAELSADLTRKIQRAAEAAFKALGCSGFSRVDFMCNDAGEYVCLEINSLPGMTRNSLVPKSAKAAGMEPPVLMQTIIDCSLRKRGVAV